MLKKIVNGIGGFLVRTGNQGRLIRSAILLFLVSPVLILAAAGYVNVWRQQTELALARRIAIASLAAATLEERLKRLTDVGISLATRVRFRALVQEGAWEEAVMILQDTPRDFPFIERVFLTDPEGTLQADTPPLPGVRGKNFAFRDWYSGVSSRWAPYVSEVYKRTAAPPLNVIASAIPITDDAGKVLGILVIQVLVDRLLEWAHAIDAGPAGFVYFVDQRGHALAHPKFPPQGDIADFSQVPAVERALRGERGVGVMFNPVENEERLSAFALIPAYGWAVVFEEPTRAAFAERTAALRRIAIFDAIAIILISLLASVILRTVRTLKQNQEEIQARTLQLSEQYNRLTSAVGGLTLGFVMLDEQERVIILNQALRDILGLDSRQAPELTLDDISRLLEGAFDLKAHAKRCIAEERKIEVRDIPFGAKFLRIFLSPITRLRDSGGVIGIVILIEDITAQKLLERAKEEFLAVASHELRTPLTAIRGNAALLEEVLADTVKQNKDVREMISDIHGGSVRLIAIVNEFLDASRIEQGKVVFKKESFDVVPLIQEVVRELKPRATAKGLTLELREPPSSLPLAFADRERTTQVVSNLVDNAVKYTETGRVTVTISSEDGFLAVRVTDTGVGISSQNQALLFQKFQQAGEQVLARDVTQGTGMGLYISKLIVETMGGTIGLEDSESGKGSTFRFTLPTAAVDKASQAG